MDATTIGCMLNALDETVRLETLHDSGDCARMEMKRARKLRGTNVRCHANQPQRESLWTGDPQGIFHSLRGSLEGVFQTPQGAHECKGLIKTRHR